MGSNPLCPCKKRKFEHRHVQREGSVKTQGEDGHLQAKECQGLLVTPEARKKQGRSFPLGSSERA